MKIPFLKRFFGLVGLALVGLTLAVRAGVAQDLPVVGFLFSGGSASTVPAELVGIRYTGECPGHAEASVGARFFSKSLRPAPKLRAVIRNVTFGFAGETKPYTDREYFNGDLSEDFDIRFGDRHEGQFLAVRPGENQFEYEIRRDKQAIETGKFSAVFEAKTIERDRDSHLVRRETKYCRKYDKKGRHCLEESVRSYYERVCN